VSVARRERKKGNSNEITRAQRKGERDKKERRKVEEEVKD